jgi:hypothetical protein
MLEKRIRRDDHFARPFDGALLRRHCG